MSLDFFLKDGMFALYGVIVGALLTWLGEYFRQGFDRERRAQYLAVRVVIALDTFLQSCAVKLTYNPELPDYADPDAQWYMPDVFQVPADLDWTSISPDLAYRILQIPNDDQTIREQIDAVYEMVDGYVARDVWQANYVSLALRVSNIANELRKKYKLSARPHTEWDPVEEIKGLNAKLEKRSQKTVVKRESRKAVIKPKEAE